MLLPCLCFLFVVPFAFPVSVAVNAHFCVSLARALVLALVFAVVFALCLVLVPAPAHSLVPTPVHVLPSLAVFCFLFCPASVLFVCFRFVLVYANAFFWGGGFVQSKNDNVFVPICFLLLLFLCLFVLFLFVFLVLVPAHAIFPAIFPIIVPVPVPAPVPVLLSRQFLLLFLIFLPPLNVVVAFVICLFLLGSVFVCALVLVFVVVFVLVPLFLAGVCLLFLVFAKVLPALSEAGPAQQVRITGRVLVGTQNKDEDCGVEEGVEGTKGCDGCPTGGARVG